MLGSQQHQCTFRYFLIYGIVCSIFWASVALAQLAPPVSSSTGGVQVQDEGTFQCGTRIENFTGVGVTASCSGGKANISIPGGGGGGNFVEVSVNLGTSGGLTFSQTVVGQAWVTVSSDIICSPFATSADGQTVETYVAGGLSVNASDRVVGTGFTVWIYSPHGATGTFRVHCTGS